MGTMASKINILVPSIIPPLSGDPSGEYGTWPVVDYPTHLGGTVVSDVSDHASYVDDGVTVVPGPFVQGGDSSDFIVASADGLHQDGNDHSNLDDMEFHLSIRDSDSLARGMLTLTSGSCTMMLYDVVAGGFTSMSIDAKFVRPLDGVIDRNSGKAYILDEFRIIDNVIHFGGSLVEIDLSDGSTIRMDKIDNVSLFRPRAVALATNILAVADTGNHRILLFSRGDLSFVKSIGFDFMRFPHSVAISDTEIIVKAFDGNYMTPLMIHMQHDGTILKKMYSSSPVGWTDLSGTVGNGNVLACDTAGGFLGINMISAEGSIVQQRIFDGGVPNSICWNGMLGDSIAIWTTSL
jgi:hypothetical protein